MKRETILKFHDLKKRAEPKRILGLNAKSSTDKELHELQKVVMDLTKIVESITHKGEKKEVQFDDQELKMIRELLMNLGEAESEIKPSNYYYAGKIIEKIDQYFAS